VKSTQHSLLRDCGERGERRQPVGNLQSVVEFRTTEDKIHPEERA